MVAGAVAAVEDGSVDVAQQLVIVFVDLVADDDGVHAEGVEGFHGVVEALAHVEGGSGRIKRNDPHTQFLFSHIEAVLGASRRFKKQIAGNFIAEIGNIDPLTEHLGSVENGNDFIGMQVAEFEKMLAHIRSPYCSYSCGKYLIYNLRNYSIIPLLMQGTGEKWIKFFAAVSATVC